MIHAQRYQTVMSWATFLGATWDFSARLAEFHARGSTTLHLYRAWNESRIACLREIPARIRRLDPAQHQSSNACASNIQIELQTSRNQLPLKCPQLLTLQAIHLSHQLGIHRLGNTLEKSRHSTHLIDETSRVHALHIKCEADLLLLHSSQLVTVSPPMLIRSI